MGVAWGLCCCSAIFCKKDMTAESLAAAMERSWARISRSRLMRAISCILQASSLAIRSCSRFSMASRNLFWRSSCLWTTCFIRVSKKSFHFLFLLARPSISSSDEVDEDVEFDMRSVDDMLGNVEGGTNVVAW